MTVSRIVIVAFALVALAGCEFSQVGDAAGNLPPVRTALYVGKGVVSRSEWSWLQITTFSDGMRTTLVDADSIRGGALREADLLIVPGGSSHAISAALGESGRREVADFVRRGGGYLGTCAGAYLVSESSPSHPNMIGLMPYTSRDGNGTADMIIRFNGMAKRYGLKPGTCRVTYGEGPVFEPGQPVEDADFDMIATYGSSIATWTDKPQPSMAGLGAVVAGRCGKGKIFALAVHPEVDLADHAMLRDGIRYLTGRAVDWKFPQRRRGDLCVGVNMTNGFDSLAAAEAMRSLLRGEVPGVDLLPVTDARLAEGARRHLDVVIPATVDGAKSLASLVKAPAVASQPYPAKQPKVRVAAYVDDGGSNFPVTERLALSPEFDLRIITAADIRNGELKNFDMLLQPGGWAPTQYDRLGPQGIAAIDRFVRGGGSLYAICAGAFLVSQSVPGDAPRGDLIPWSDLGGNYYRGWGPIKVRITEAGAQALGVPAENRTIMYWGGPVFRPGSKPVPDADIRPWGDYFGYNLNTCSTTEFPPMTGNAAFLGGTLGKGRMFVSGPHPEKDDRTFDIVDGAIAYLTGVKPRPVCRNRQRGALSVGLPHCRNTAFARTYVGTLLRDRSLDTRIGWDVNDLKHLDAVVIIETTEKTLTPVLREFAANGGKVIAVADTPKRRAAVEGKDWVIAIPDIASIPAALQRL